MRPTSSPVTQSPTELPSQKPSVSASPTTSPQPSSQPTISPQPTQPPTSFPTVAPSFIETDISRASFRQDLRLEGCNTGDEGSCGFNNTQVETIVSILEAFTPMLDTDTSRVETECTVDGQTTEVVSEGNETEPVVRTALDYTCSYLSNHVKVGEYSDRLLDLINSEEPSTFFTMLREEQLPVAEADEARLRIVQTAAPTTSPRPSASPTMRPTISSPPSSTPTSSPTTSPTARPTVAGITAQTPSPTSEIRADAKLGIIVPISTIAGIGLVGAVLFFFQSWKKNAGLLPRYSGTPNSGNSFSGWAGGNSDDDMTDRNVVLSPTESLLSNKSLLSKGESGVGEESYDENDGTKNLQDEFDQFKDQNLEQLRANVEENLSGFEGIMSEAVTKALMGDDDSQVDTRELLWGCSPNPAGTEIEASALYEVSDWLKRNEGATVERKRAFMQEILNKMVTSVRFGVLDAEVASRTIHESAAILNLELAEELPTTTVIISGMRKTTTADNMISALSEFGGIDVGAVASGRRGFGIVRFKQQEAVHKALRRYRRAEIVILDVSIQMKVIAQDRTASDEN